MAKKIPETSIVAIGNQKGGVGKTTLTVQLARALAETGKRCLIIDLDMNHGATNHFGIESDSYLGSYEVLLGAESPEDVTITADVEDEVWLPEGIDLIPASRKLENIDAAIRERNKMMDPHALLSAPLANLRGKYDFIFLDTAPNANTPTIAAYKAADFFLLSAMPETFAIQGLNDALSDIRSAQQHGNPNIKVLGVVLCAVDKRTRLSKELVDYVHDIFQGRDGRSRKFDTMIGRSTIISAAQKLGKTVFETEPTHKVTEEFRALALEFLERHAEFYGDGAPQGREDDLSRPISAAGEGTVLNG